MTIQYNSNYDGTLPFSDSASQIHCGANVEQTVTVPGAVTAQYQALFAYIQDSNVFVRINAAPAIPLIGTVGSEQYNEFRPEKRYVKGGDVIHFITPDASAFIGVTLRKLQG
ncbi:hypothetical protein UFOVP685_6 [uncultured Caudovirales phage]|uniref:Uncharacterized protein n=1 Tax=uncultured Caudovirales phage TaxID=2100421 RepID=A0A6J5NPF6_9CAUD|nr:hypothetical protein UFOVP590_17 [uncultured Caudovirales phage]CAB4157154.1 hypothetical protein UFOVP685_6 [uncultured Caudovirales phage]CAB5225554.1 hypothetical protein UFOVP750_46 [uncultured Caudovirales phage]